MGLPRILSRRHAALPVAVALALALTDAMVYAAEQRPITEAALNEPATAAAWRTIPSWVVIGAEDKAIPPAGQRFMARRAHARVTEIPGRRTSPCSPSPGRSPR